MILSDLHKITFNECKILFEKAHSLLPTNTLDNKIKERAGALFTSSDSHSFLSQSLSWDEHAITEFSQSFLSGLPLLLSLFLSDAEENFKKAFLFLSYGPHLKFDAFWQLSYELALPFFCEKMDTEDLMTSLIAQPLQLDDSLLEKFCKEQGLYGKINYEQFVQLMRLILAIYHPDLSKTHQIARDFFASIIMESPLSPLTLAHCGLSLDTSLLNEVLKHIAITADGFDQSPSLLLEFHIPSAESQIEELSQFLKTFHADELPQLSEKSYELLNSIARERGLAEPIKTLLALFDMQFTHLEVESEPLEEEFHFLEVDSHSESPRFSLLSYFGIQSQ
jgi:hypothetical protein